MTHVCCALLCQSATLTEWRKDNAHLYVGLFSDICHSPFFRDCVNLIPMLLMRQGSTYQRPGREEQLPLWCPWAAWQKYQHMGCCWSAWGHTSLAPLGPHNTPRLLTFLDKLKNVLILPGKGTKATHLHCYFTSPPLFHQQHTFCSAVPSTTIPISKSNRGILLCGTMPGNGKGMW